MRILPRALDSSDWIFNVGALPPDISIQSLASTSATVFCSQPPFSFTPVGYTITLTRVTGIGQVLCGNIMDNRTTIISSNVKQFPELEEFSTYRVTVIAVFGINFGISATALASANFTTPGAGMINFRCV